MSLIINKDGKQLGPYTLDEARALVLTGNLTPEDWTWSSTENDWVALKDIPGYYVARPKPVAAAAATVTAAPVVATGAPAGALPPEQDLWRGHPSQVLNAGIYFFWVAILIIVAVVAVFIILPDSALWALIVSGTLALIGAANAAGAYFHLRAIEYIVTTQRIRIISGLFSKTIQEIELFRVKDTMASQSFFLRLFGMGTIIVLSGDEKQPRLVLSGVPQAIELRERLRQEVMNLRQRFGVREVDVM
jgi:membrane protein YdbS with pleckstrin-like domain